MPKGGNTMAVMTAEQTTAELQRKKNLGIAPTSQSNVAQYNTLTKQKPVPDPNKFLPTKSSVGTGASVGAGLQPVTPNPVISPTPVSSATTSTTNNVPSEYDAWKTKQSELFSKLEGLSNAQFAYNPETDPAYQAQRQLAQLRAKDANMATMETMNDRGLLQSTVTNSQLDQNSQRAEQEAAAYIPQYRDQAYGQFQDNINRNKDLLGYATDQENTQYGRNYQEGRDAVNDNFSRADRTGILEIPGANEGLSRLAELGELFKQGDKTQQAQYRQEANQVRSELTRLGVDPTLFDENLNTDQRLANIGKGGISTLAKQGQDYNQAADSRNFEFQKVQQEWDNAFAQGQFDFQKAQTVWDNNFKDKSFAQSVKDAAASRGLQWANLNQNQQEFIANQAFREKQFDYQMEQDAKGLDQNKFNQGMEAYKTTGQMPSYMSGYGINVNGMNDSGIKDDLNAMYGQISSGTNPADLIKIIDDKVKLGIEDKSNGDKLKQSLYMLYPELDPSTPKEKQNSSILSSKYTPSWNPFNYSGMFK
jgi:hypothetical protein